MTKKVLSAVMTFVMLFITACQSDIDQAVNVGDTSIVTFNISTPEIGTRSYSDGKSAKVLHYAVYDVYTKDGQEVITYLGKLKPTTWPEFREGSMKQTLSLSLASNNKYRIVFWAAAEASENENAPYQFDPENKTVIVNYENALCNDESRDAFYGYKEFTMKREGQTETVKLQRPFAQLNIGTKDYQAAADANFVPTVSKVTVNNIYKTFNLFDGTVSNEVTEAVTFDYNSIERTETFPVTGYEYLAMNYLLVNQELVDITVTYKDEVSGRERSRTVNSVPVQRNYRTNVLGEILTGNTNFDITIDPGYVENILFASSNEELKEVVKTSGTIKLTDDIELKQRLYIEAGTDVRLDLNGKKITVDENYGTEYLFYVREGGSLTIDGNGTVETATPGPVIFCPVGDLVIENGTFIRNIPEGYTGSVNSMFVGTKPSGGWESTGVTIKGGYFDPGYYAADAADVEDILAGTETLEETEEDINKRGKSGDANRTRKALKNNTMVLFNRANNYFKIYGGTFVGASPAWGDEGCMLPTTPQYLRPWSYYQGPLLDGQTFNEDGIVLPEGYTITKGTHEDDRPTYTVSYTKPDTDE